MSVFAQAILQRAIPEPNSGCWLWSTAVDTHGYGRLHIGKNKWTLAHRASYAEFVGPVPDGACVCHRCDQPSCVNPDHLFLGDFRTNAVDRDGKGRQAKGSRIGTSKLTEDQVREIRRRYANGENQAALASEFGVVRQNIHHIIHNESWRHTR